MRDASKETVAIAYCHPVDSVGADFHVSLLKLIVKDANSIGRVKLHLHLGSGANITNARNELVRQFLRHPMHVDWMFFVDADMTFEPDIIDRLVEVADPKERPIVGALCFALDRGEGSTQEIVPTIYGFAKPENEDDQPQMVRYQSYPEDTLMPVAATGSAAILVHRTVYETIEPKWESPWNWYQEWLFYGEPIGEDVTFCLKAAQAGFPIYVHTGIATGHVKPFIMNQELFAKQFARTAPAPANPIAAPADGAGATYVPTYVVIPVKNRLDLTTAILDQLKEQGGYDEILVFDNGSTDGTDAYLDTQDIASVYDAAGAGIYNLWNQGLKEAQNLAGGGPCNVAILNNDLILGDHWLETMAREMRGSNALAVCGNYDGRNGPAVQQTTSTFKDGGFAGFAFMVRGECMGSVVPYFDEAYTWYFGDDDFINEIHKAGCWAGLVTTAAVEHIGGGSQTSSNGTRERLGTPELRASVDKDTQHYVGKWSGDD